MIPVLPTITPLEARPTSPSVSRSPSRFGQPGGLPTPPVTYPPSSELDALYPGPNAHDGEQRGRGAVPKGGVARDGKMLLELVDGTAYEGYAFGADKNISGECVFQTGTLGCRRSWKSRS